MKNNSKSEIRCTNCSDIIDTSHNPKNCQKCGQLVVGFKEINKPLFISNPAIALLITIVTIIFVIVLISNVGIWLGIDSRNIPSGICVPVSVVLIFSTGIYLFKYLVSLGEDKPNE